MSNSGYAGPPWKSFQGQTKEVVLVVAGIHGSELSGIEVARWLQVKLARRERDKDKPPLHTSVIVPDLYPEQSRIGRRCLASDPEVKSVCKISAGGRHYIWNRHPVATNRQFPPPGRALESVKNGPIHANGEHIQEDADGNNIRTNIPLLAPTQWLLQQIERYRPVRIVSIHGHHPVESSLHEYGIDAPGIFVDPRYDYDRKLAQRDPLDPPGTMARIDGADICKFDVGVDAGWPILGVIKRLHDWFALVDTLVHGTYGPNSGLAPVLLQRKMELETLVNNVKLATQNLLSDKKVDELNKEYVPRLKGLEEALQVFGYANAKLRTDSALTDSGKKDDAMALSIAQFIGKIKKFPGSVPGNHLDQQVPVVHYAASAGHSAGFSLGDWGPVQVINGTGNGTRNGAPVFTIETNGNEDSGAFGASGEQLIQEDIADSVQPVAPKNTGAAERMKKSPKKRERCKELQVIAEALMMVALE